MSNEVETLEAEDLEQIREERRELQKQLAALDQRVMRASMGVVAAEVYPALDGEGGTTWTIGSGLPQSDLSEVETYETPQEAREAAAAEAGIELPEPAEAEAR